MSTLGPLASAAQVNTRLDQLATCRDSWFEHKDDAAWNATYARDFLGVFQQNARTASFVPTRPLLMAGLPVVEAHPERVGMGVGFSVTVGASFPAARSAVEQATGRTFSSCERSDGMRMCDLELAPRKTMVLMSAADDRSGKTLVGCFYYYEK